MRDPALVGLLIEIFNALTAVLGVLGQVVIAAVGDDTRTVLRLDPRLAPYKVAVLPLSKKDTLSLIHI